MAKPKKVKEEVEETKGTSEVILTGKIYCKKCNAGFTTTGSAICPKCEGK